MTEADEGLARALMAKAFEIIGEATGRICYSLERIAAAQELRAVCDEARRQREERGAP